MRITSDVDALIKVVGKSAPLLASMLGSPLAGIGISWIASLFGIDKSNTQGILSAIEGDPDSATKLKQLEYQNQETLQSLADNDTANAREREELILQLTGKFDWVQHFCAILLVIGFLVLCGIVEFRPIDTTDHDILYMLLGIMGSTFTQVYQYYFGSSRNK